MELHASEVDVNFSVGLFLSAGDVVCSCVCLCCLHRRVTVNIQSMCLHSTDISKVCNIRTHITCGCSHNASSYLQNMIFTFMEKKFYEFNARFDHLFIFFLLFLQCKPRVCMSSKSKKEKSQKIRKKCPRQCNSIQREWVKTMSVSKSNPTENRCCQLVTRILIESHLWRPILASFFFFLFKHFFFFWFFLCLQLFCQINAKISFSSFDSIFYFK